MGGGGGGDTGATAVAHEDLYSPLIGAAFTFNLVVGAGALSMPAAFASAGYVAGTLMLLLLSILSWMSAEFVVEAMSIANAVVKTDSKSATGTKAVVRTPAGARSTVDNESSDYALDLRCELGFMANLFFTAWERKLFYMTLVVYLYGDLCIYAVGGCIGGLGSSSAYHSFLTLFTLFICPFTFFDVSKTQVLQIITTAMRWLSFIVMILIAAVGIVHHRGFTHPENTVPVQNVSASNLAELPQLFGVCIYSFMCHHSLPSLLTPINDKSTISHLLKMVIGLTLVFYLLLSFTAMFRFTVEELTETDGLYTLNFADYHVHTVSRGLEFFPVFVLSANFPIIAITLRNNLKTLLNTTVKGFISEPNTKYFYPILAVGPPIVVAYFTDNVAMLVSYTGSYAGVGIQYVIPAILVMKARRLETNQNFKGAPIHRASCTNPRWIYGVIGWSCVCWVIVSYNIATS